MSELPNIELHHVSIGPADLLLVVGDQQSQTAARYDRLTDAILDVATDFGVEDVFALGGVPTGELVDEYGVLGAVSDTILIEPLEAHGVAFRANEPAGGVVGVSGLLLGMGGQRGMDVACLMGEASGYLVDPMSANAILQIFAASIGFEVDYTELPSRADEMESVVQRLQALQEGGQDVSSGDEDRRYID